MAEIRTHYDNLQVKENASPEVIKGSYRYLSQRWHPDKNPDQRERAERITKLLNEAYEILSDPVKRRQHDQWILDQRGRSKEQAGSSPQSEQQGTQQRASEDLKRQPPISLWNPSAAANWSLLFSPAFGAWFHAKNWSAIGDIPNARRSMTWFYACVGFLASSMFLPERLITGLAFWVLIAWYFAAAKKQIKYVRETYGSSYTKKSWLKPLGLAFLCLAAILLVAE